MGKEEKDRNDAKEWIKDAVAKMRNLHPDYIFLTETGAVPYGYALKGAWKKAYPNEPLPRFYRIEKYMISSGQTYHLPNRTTNEQRSANINGERRYFEKRIKKGNARIIVFDEGSGVGPMGTFRKKSSVASDYGETGMVDEQEHPLSSTSTLGIVTKEIIDSLENVGRKDAEVFAMRGGDMYIHVSRNIKVGDTLLSRRPTSRLLQAGHFDGADSDPKIESDSDAVRERTGKGLFTGSITKDNVRRKRAIVYIKELKYLGKEAGEEIRQERQTKRKTLDSTLGIISIAGFLFSVLFLSGITGNVIGNSTTSNIIGVVLFLVGIVGAFLYFRRR